MRRKNEYIIMLNHTITLSPTSALNPDLVRFYGPINRCPVIAVIYIVIKWIRCVFPSAMVRIGKAFGGYVAGLVAFIKPILKVQISRVIAGGISQSVLVAHSTSLLGAMDLPVTRHLAVETNRVASGAVSCVIYLSEVVLENYSAWVHI